MALLVSGALCLANAKTDEVVIRQYYNALLDATDLDFTNKENAKSLVMWIFSIEDSIDQLKKEQAHLKKQLFHLQKENTRLRQQLRKQNHAKK